MKKCICVFLVVLVVLLPMISLADGGYFLLKTIMEMQLLSDVEVPESEDYSNSVQEIEKTCLCIINYPDSWISISGRDLLDNYECLLYADLTFEQLVMYSMMVCAAYAQIDEAQTTSTTFNIAFKYGDSSEEMVIIDNAEDANSYVKLISDSLDSMQ